MPMAKVRRYTRSVSMPISVAASRSWAVARITRPVCVHFMKANSAMVSATATAHATTCERLNAVPATRRTTDECHVLQRGGQPDRGEDLHVVRGVDDAPHDEHVDEPAHAVEDRDRDQQHDVRVEPLEREREEGEVHAEHEKLAVGEVDHAHDAEDQREADGDEGVDDPEQDRRDRELRDDVYLRWSQAPSGIHFARLVVNSSGHTVTSSPFCHCSM